MAEQLHALQLVPDEEGQAVVERDRQRLRDAGLLVQRDEPPAVTPCITVVTAPSLPEAALDVAKVRLGNLLPVRARFAGLLLLGRDQPTVARAVELDDDVVRRVLAVRVQVPDRRSLGWLPCLELASGLSRSDASRAVDVLGDEAAVLRVVELRHWDAVKGQLRVIAQA